MNNKEIVVLDFETTGMTTDSARIIEVGAALVSDGKIVETFSSLCNPGQSIPHFITSLTGITNRMIEGKPPPEAVMREFASFAGEHPILAHNASFDRRFYRAEMRRIDIEAENPFLCSMLLARRLMQDADNHKLSTLRHYIGFEGSQDHQEHRALDDVKVTVALWNHLNDLVVQLTGNSAPPLALFQKLMRTPKHLVEQRLMEFA